MTTKQNTGQTSVAGGTALTTSNSGGTAGDAFDGPVPYATSPATATWSATAPVIADTKSVRLVNGGSGLARVYWEYATSSTVFQGRTAVRHRVDPGGPNLILALTDTTYSGNYPFQVVFTTRGGTRHALIMCKGVEIADLGTWPSFGSAQTDFYWVRYGIVKGTTTSTPKGSVKLKLHDWDGTELLSYDSTVTSPGGIDTGTTNFKRMIFGGNSNTVMDADYAWQKAGTDGSSLVELPTMTLVAPTVTAPPLPDPFQPGVITIQDVRGQDSDGTIKSVWASIVSGPTAPTPTATPKSGLNTASCYFDVSFEAEPSSEYVVEYWVRDNADQDSTHVQQTISVYGDSDTVSVLADMTPTGWTINGGAATQLAAVTDGLTTTDVRSGDAPSGLIKEYRVAAVPVGVPLRFWTTSRRDPGGGAAINYTAKCYTSAGVLVETETLDIEGQPLTLGASNTTQWVEFALSSLTTAASRVGLRVRLEYTQV